MQKENVFWWECIMKTLVWMNPTERDKREIRRLKRSKHDQCIFHSYAYDALRRLSSQYYSSCNRLDGCRMPRDEIKQLAQTLSQIETVNIMSSRDYPANAITNAVASELGCAACPVASILLAQHKYYARCRLYEYIPEASPAFERVPYHQITECQMEPPFIIKPVKAAMSVGTYHIQHRDELRDITYIPQPAYYEPFSQLLAEYTSYRMQEPEMIAEAYMKGHQVTVDGLVYDGDVHICGIVDAHFYPETLSFYAFTYPSSLPQEIQKRMQDIAHRAAHALELNNTLFNIELIYTQANDTITIVEVNPRMSSQFSFLYEAVDNLSLYQCAYDIACGQEPDLRSRQGMYPYAVSFALRTHQDAYVLATPSIRQRKRVSSMYPETCLEVCCQTGRYLSQFYQDAYTYLYAIMHVAGETFKETEETCKRAQEHLQFDFLSYRSCL